MRMGLLKAAFSPVEKLLPDRVKWELLSLAPSPYLAVAGSADSEEEYLAIGNDLFENLTDDLEAYEDNFDLSGATVLKVGTGPDRFLVQFGTRCEAVHGTDISLKKLREAKKLCMDRGVEPELHRSERGLPDIDAEFDLVYSMFVFQHMRKRTALQYLLDSFDLLAPGGLVYFSFANLDDEYNLDALFEENLQDTHSFRMRYFTTEEVEILLNRVGFTDVEVIDRGHQLFAMARKWT